MENNNVTHKDLDMKNNNITHKELDDRVVIIDNVLPEAEFVELRRVVEEGHWAYVSKPVDILGKPTPYFQFVQLMYGQDVPLSPQFAAVADATLDILPGFQSLIRIKANLITYSLSPLPTPALMGYHVDHDLVGATTAILYLSTSDAPTYFKDGTTIECVSNRLVAFPSEIMHSSSIQSDIKARMVINFNYF